MCIHTLDDILLIFMNTAMLNASSIRFRQLIDVSDWRHRIPQLGHNQFELEFALKYFFIHLCIFKPWYPQNMIQIVSFDTSQFLGFVIDLLLNDKALGGHELVFL